jgi:hypothetical protein
MPPSTCSVQVVVGIRRRARLLMDRTRIHNKEING